MRKIWEARNTLRGYQPVHKGNIRVEAWDLAGNVTRQEFCPSSPFFSVWEKTGKNR